MLGSRLVLAVLLIVHGSAGLVIPNRDYTLADDTRVNEILLEQKEKGSIILIDPASELVIEDPPGSGRVIPRPGQPSVEFLVEAEKKQNIEVPEVEQMSSPGQVGRRPTQYTVQVPTQTLPRQVHYVPTVPIRYQGFPVYTAPAQTFVRIR